MIYSKTPLRISLFGGGTDFPEFVSSHGFGQVLGFTIDKYVWTTSRICRQSWDQVIRCHIVLLRKWQMFTNFNIHSSAVFELDTRIPLNITTMSVCQAEQALAAHRLLCGFIQLMRLKTKQTALSSGELAKRAIIWYNSSR